MSFCRRSSRPRDRTCISCIGRHVLNQRATWKAKALLICISLIYYFPSVLLIGWILLICPQVLRFTDSTHAMKISSHLAIRRCILFEMQCHFKIPVYSDYSIISAAGLACSEITTCLSS